MNLFYTEINFLNFPDKDLGQNKNLIKIVKITSLMGLSLYFRKLDQKIKIANQTHQVLACERERDRDRETQ